MGNTEMAVKAGLMGAQEAGAQVVMLRLTDYDIEPCRGCMSCVFKREACPIQDQAHQIYETLLDYDGLIMGVPTYILGPTGPLKTLLDRGMGFMYGYGRMLEGRPAISIATAGIPGWEPYALPLNSLFLRALGYTIVDQFMVYGQGPGEAIYHQEALKRAKDRGRAIVEQISQGRMVYLGEELPYSCPYCHNHLLLFIGGLSVQCPNCGIVGKINTTNGQLLVDWGDLPDRWVRKEVVRHFEHQVLPSGPRFMDKRREIREKTAVYRQFSVSGPERRERS
jgi:multimeric flavodoxin WrbA